jgi:dTDP-4-dehydrorhamnose 3,5-epimerase
MRVTETSLPGVVVLEPRVFRDERGFFLETYREDQLAEAGITDRFVQANQTRSMRDPLRGLHWQWTRPQAKLVRVVNGAIFDAVVDVRRGSPSFGKWCAVELSAENFQQLYVPTGFAHGFCVTSDVADVEYLCSDYYDPTGEAGLLWSDPAIGIDWPTRWPLLSDKDARNPQLSVSRQDLPA